MQHHSLSPWEIIASLWRNRSLATALVRREVIGRYRGSTLGILWSFFNPICMLAVYVFVFSVVFKARWNVGSDSKTEFALVLFAGLLVFNLFSECINRAPTLILSNVNYVKKVVFPLEILPWVVLGSASFHMLISLTVWMAFYWIFFGLPQLTALLLPFVLFPVIFLTLGLSWMLASLGVYLRDVSQFIGIFTSVLLFMSPIFYPMSSLPPEYQALLMLNPLTPVIELVRDVLIWGKAPIGPCWGSTRAYHYYLHGWVLPGSRRHAMGFRMSSDVAIKVAKLSKCYHIYDQPRDRLKQFILPRLQRMSGLQAKEYFRNFWALRDVSFEVKKGETVGIVGRNGSGKSTLLQLICGTLNPTSGSIHTSGRIAALLELGSGFNPEFTGRENVYMNAAILGLSKEEVDSRFDSIAAFAEIGDFIEQPVKTYSSGMIVRLAFAVAINSDPEILIVDEALSVGDELFQRKCFSRMEAIRALGATILFVSHSGGTIVELCDRAILLDNGEKLAVGVPKQIVGRYQKLLYVPVEKRQSVREQIMKDNDELEDIGVNLEPSLLRL